MLQIISGADFDAILDRINLGLAQTNNIEKAEAMKQQILDKVLGFNSKLDNALPEIEIHSTIMRSVSKKLSEQAS